MILDKTNVSKCKSHYLDLTISIHRGRFIYRSYDKKEAFDFDVINYPNLLSNIPNKQAYGVFTSQLIRFCQLNSSVNYFRDDVMKLRHKFQDQNFQDSYLKAIFNQFYSNNIHIWGKFGIDIKYILE